MMLQPPFGRDEVHTGLCRQLAVAAWRQAGRIDCSVE